MKKTLMGNHAAAVAVRLARTEVVAAYPITPQTQVVEALAEMKASGEFAGRFVKVESEHSAMACLVGAAQTGVRCFTATSSQGLAYMHEMLHWAAGARLPIVMAEVNRALGAPWILWTDQTDSLAQRDTGWLQFYCSSNQEILDTTLLAFKVAEELSLPVMVNYDGFTLSHTYEPVDVPAQELVDRFLPKHDFALALDLADPKAFSALPKPQEYFRLRRRMAADMGRAHQVIASVEDEFARLFGRSYSAVEAYKADDADALLVTTGAPASTALDAVDELRKEGFKAGNLRIRQFRPFPAEALRAYARPGRNLVVVDRNFSMGQEGIFCEELKSALYPLKERPQVFGTVAGLGGGDITVELLKEIWLDAKQGRGDALQPVWMEDAR
ncbi:MAG: pyruvate ferredoxin oxidoreductase [Elusimicrobia bacterium]|nr:pyruvate ferredoxin oxidoreductase [Elusimicrobiota bacterium]